MVRKDRIRCLQKLFLLCELRKPVQVRCQRSLPGRGESSAPSCGVGCVVFSRHVPGRTTDWQCRRQVEKCRNQAERSPSPLVNVGPTSASHLCHLQLSWHASCLRSLAPGLVLPFRRDERDPWLIFPVVFGGVWVGRVCLGAFGLAMCVLACQSALRTFG